jgi:hypothetical protein
VNGTLVIGVHSSVVAALESLAEDDETAGADEARGAAVVTAAASATEARTGFAIEGYGDIGPELSHDRLLGQPFFPIDIQPCS